MIRRTLITIGITAAILASDPSLAGASAVSKARQGDRLYRGGKYAEALEKYNEASALKPDDQTIQYNRAAALYRNAEFEKAFDAFLASFSEDTGSLAEKAVYNAGNSKYREGEKKEARDPGSAMSDYKDALEFYKKAIEVSPEDEDAKVNYEYTLKKIRKLEEELKEKFDLPNQQKDQQKDQEKEQDQQKDQEKGQDKEGQKGEDQEKDQQEARGKRQEARGGERREARGERQEEQKEKENQFQKGEKPDTIGEAAGAMTPEEAERLLRGQEEEEADMRYAMRQKKAAGRPKVLKNW
ncbi:MAG: tetratricopeptide repeat protein [Candidatus Omnitrophica bacterium]|nr:tetratricopeptide repeat protein [Candidatus Omnitrophota bacterium]